MYRFVALNCIIAWVLCLVALLISIYPGALQQMHLILLLLSCVGVPIWIITFVVLGVAAVRRKADERKSLAPWKRIAGTVLLVLFVYMSLRFYVPRRVVFPTCQAAFASYIHNAPESDYSGEPLGRWLGVYYIDRYAKDPRRGVYFRVTTGGDGIGPNAISYGFAYQPNPLGSPFGAKYYSPAI